MQNARLVKRVFVVTNFVTTSRFRLAARKGKNMCVGLSAKVVSVSGGEAVVDATGARRAVSAELLDGLQPGDYVMVHAGMAIAKISDDGQTGA